MLKDAYKYGVKKVLIACGRTNLHAGIDGLSTLIRMKYREDPLEEGTLFLFCGTKKNVIKGLLFEGDGFLLLSKRLTKGSFPWPASRDEMEHYPPEKFKILMEGYKVGLLKKNLLTIKGEQTQDTSQENEQQAIA